MKLSPKAFRSEHLKLMAALIQPRADDCNHPLLLLRCLLMKSLLAMIGLILILEGLPYAAFPEKMQAWLRQLAATSPNLLRLIGILSVGTGLLLCYLTQRTSIF